MRILRLPIAAAAIRRACPRTTPALAVAWCLGMQCVACAAQETQLQQPVGRSPHRPHAPPAAVEPSFDERLDAELRDDKTGASKQSSPQGFTLCSLPDDAAEALLFSTNSTALRPRSVTLLDQIADCMLRGELIGSTVLIRGYADPRGSREYNLELSAERALSVRRYLLRRGVAPRRVLVAPVGELQARGTGPESWQLDRRVELSLVSSDRSETEQRAETDPG